MGRAKKKEINKIITLSGNPLSTQHAYLQRGKIRFMRKEAKERKEAYKWEAKYQWKSAPITENISIRVRLYFGDRRKRDWDNYHKLSMDALSGIVFVDDVQIVSALVEKYYSKENPRIEIEIL